MGVSVIKKLAAVVTPAILALSGVTLAGASAQAADDYTASVRTSCNLTVPAVVQVGHTPRIRIHVRPNAPAPAAGIRAAQRAADRPTGAVTVSIQRGGTGIFSRTVDYNGAPVTIIGPVVNRPGHYVVNARFKTADGTVFRSCQDTTAFDVGDDNSDGPGPGPGPDGGDDPGGLLPDTGGPDLRWLILGLSLMVAGLGLVVAARERPRSPYLV